MCKLITLLFYSVPALASLLQLFFHSDDENDPLAAWERVENERKQKIAEQMQELENRWVSFISQAFFYLSKVL